MLSNLDRQDFDELWLFALDVGGGLSDRDLTGIARFHHFVDYNWDISKGCPSFVDEPPGEGMQKEPQALADIQCYVKNLALWLTPTNDH